MNTNTGIRLLGDLHATRSRARQFQVWEGHYTYPGTSLTFVPTFAGGMFEGLMANLVVPETTLGPAQLRVSTTCGGREVQIKYATRELRLPGVGDVAVEHGGRHW